MKLTDFAKSTILNMFHSLGYEIRRYNRNYCGSYESVYPSATYSPWNRDKVFLETYHRIKSHTLVDKYRCFELWSLVEQSKKTDGELIEIGVWKGGTGTLIAKKAQLCGIVDHVYLCDTFSGVVKNSENDSTYKGGEHADTTRQAVESLLDDLELTNVTILEGIFPEQTAHFIKGSKFRFCHIDVDVYQSAKDIIEWIWQKISIGGIIVYDDYGFQSCDGITKYVEEQIHNPDRIVFHNLNGHAVIIKIG